MTALQVETLALPEKPHASPLPVRDPRRPPDLRWPYLVLVGLLCLLLFLPGINSGDLWRTENLRALVATEFLRSGDWIVPRLYGEPYLTKPPGMYAAIALASWPVGEVRTWTARLPSALAATVTVFLFYWYFARAFGRKGGLLAALVLPMSPMWLDKATAAEIDMLQVAWVTGAILCFLRALEGEETGRQPDKVEERFPRVNGWWLGAMLCVAGGVLTKWTAPLFFYFTVIPLLWWRGRLRLLLGRQHVVCATVAAILVLLWASAVIARVGWESFSYTVTREGLARVYPQKYGEPYRWWLVPVHPFRLLATTLPWSLLALLTLRPGFAQLWDEPRRRLLQALHCWTWPNMIFWSCIAEHAPRHSFPLFPGVAGLAAFVWIAWLTGRLRWPWPRIAPGTVLSLALVGWVAAKAAHVSVIVSARNEPRQPRAKGAQLAALMSAEHKLYVWGLKDKDEGILFHYGRAVSRLSDPEHGRLPAAPFYCLLEEYEWERWTSTRRTEVAARLRGETGNPLILIRVFASP